METIRNRKRHAEMSVHEVKCIERNHIVRPPISSSSHLPSEQDNLAPVTGTGNAHGKTWKEYVLSAGLIDKDNIEREVKAFTFNSCYAQGYKNNLKNSLDSFDEFIAERFSLQVVADKAINTEPSELKISNLEMENECALKKLSGGNCISEMDQLKGNSSI